MNSKQNVGKESKGGISPVTAAVAGVIAGAGVAIAGAIALSDKNNRKRVEGVINNAKNKVAGFAKDSQKIIDDKKGEAKAKFLEEKENIKVAVIDVVDSFDNLAEDTKNKVNKTTKVVKDSVDEQVKGIGKEIKKAWQK